MDEAFAGRLGLQAKEAQVSEVILVVRNRRGLEALVNDTVKLGADASVAVGPVGAGVKGGTTSKFRADIVAFSKTKGLFGGCYRRGDIVQQY